MHRICSAARIHLCVAVWIHRPQVQAAESFSVMSATIPPSSASSKSTRLDNLDLRIRDAESDLVELTPDLIRIPTINPPGDGYGEICD